MLTPEEAQSLAFALKSDAAEELGCRVTHAIQYRPRQTGKFLLTTSGGRDALDADNPEIVMMAAAWVQTELTKAGWPLRVSRWKHATWWRKGWIEVVAL